MILGDYDEKQKISLGKVSVHLNKKPLKVPVPEMEEEEKKEEPKNTPVRVSLEIPESDMKRIGKYLQTHRNSADPVHKRLTALVSLSEGFSIVKISKNLGVSTSTVQEWKDRYLKRGLNGLMSMKYYRWKK